MICQEIPSELFGDIPVLVVGAGPAGIVQALELRRHGVEVTMLAGGMDGFRADFQALADAEIADPTRHAPMQIAVRRAFGVPRFSGAGAACRLTISISPTGRMCRSAAGR